MKSMHSLYKRMLLLKTLWRLGLRNAAYVGWYKFTLKIGWRKRLFPITSLACVNSINGNYSAEKLAFPFDETDLLKESDELCRGYLRYFSDQQGFIGNPPDWFRNPFTGQNVQAPDRHWTQIPSFGEGTGDIKYVWEPSRFCWAPIVARAYRVSGDPKYLRLLQEWAVDWLARNQVNTGPNWKCGQECSIRMLNVLLAVVILTKPDKTHEEAAIQPYDLPWSQEWLKFFIQQHLKRISRNLRYALTQQNNHGVSEAAGLYIGGVFLENVLSTGSDEYISCGRKWLEELAQQLIYPDGTFSQYSFVYHRLVLDMLSMACYWNKQTKDLPFSDEFCKRFDSAVDWLYQMSDANGHVPNSGANDGTLAFHLTQCDYGDFRPSLEFANNMLTGNKLDSFGKWQEGLFWLSCLPESSTVDKIRTARLFPNGGYVKLQGNHSWAIVRCPVSKNHRPSHADALHFDLWVNGNNVLRDAGTYLYNCPPLWESYFKSTSAHNTVTVDGLDQMVKHSRFLWLNWTKSRIRHFEINPALDFDHMEAEHYGYLNGQTGVLHRRAVVRCQDKWAIVDDLIGTRKRDLCLRWRLQPGSWEILQDQSFYLSAGNVLIQLISPNAIETRFATTETDTEIAWESLYYGERHSIPCVVSKVRESKCRWLTLINVNGDALGLDSNGTRIIFRERVIFDLVPMGLKELIQLRRLD